MFLQAGGFGNRLFQYVTYPLVALQNFFSLCFSMIELGVCFDVFDLFLQYGIQRKTIS